MTTNKNDEDKSKIYIDLNKNKKRIGKMKDEAPL